MTTECTEKFGQICERMRAVNAENERLLAANRYSLDMFEMLNADYRKLRELSKEYIHALAVIRAENERYRAALVEIIDTEVSRAPSLQTKSEQIALNALAIRRTETGPLSDDSGPISYANQGEKLPLITEWD